MKTIVFSDIDGTLLHSDHQMSVATKEAILSLQAKDIPFVRVDFYIVDSHIYFGEMTFFPASGFEAFAPEEWDAAIGSWISLPEKSGCNLQ